MGPFKKIQAAITGGLMVSCLLFGNTPFKAQETSSSNGTSLPTNSSSVDFYKNRKISYDTYILGAGDKLLIELLDLPELTGTFTIGPDGILYLPRLRALQVEDLTIEELRLFL